MGVTSAERVNRHLLVDRIERIECGRHLGIDLGPVAAIAVVT